MTQLIHQPDPKLDLVFDRPKSSIRGFFPIPKSSTSLTMARLGGKFTANQPDRF
jgi:hypothetical protein